MEIELKSAEMFKKHINEVMVFIYIMKKWNTFQQIKIIINYLYMFFIENIEKTGKYPVILKSNNGRSSFHTYKINSGKEFIKKYNISCIDILDEILIQEFVELEEYRVPIVN